MQTLLPRHALYGGVTAIAGLAVSALGRLTISYILGKPHLVHS